MKITRLGVPVVLLFVALGGSLLGCPTGPDVKPVILVDPSSLSFGTVTTTLPLEINKSSSSRTVPPVNLETTVPWLTITPDQVDVNGAKAAQTVNVTINRALMPLGASTTTIEVSAYGLVPVEVTVTASRAS